MDKEFSSALHKAIDKFGKDIVKEKCFVDIVSDYYPAMVVDHPAWKKVLTAIIVEGFGNDILVCNNSVDARLCVDKYTALVAKKNGFDKKLVESMLLELCSTLSIPVASPVQNRPVKPVNPQQKPNRKPTQKPINTPPSNTKNKPATKPQPTGNAKKAPKNIFAEHRKQIVTVVVSAILLIIIGSAIYGFFNDNLWNDIEFPLLFFAIPSFIGILLCWFEYGDSFKCFARCIVVMLLSAGLSMTIWLPRVGIQTVCNNILQNRISNKVDSIKISNKKLHEKYLKESPTLGFAGFLLNMDITKVQSKENEKSIIRLDAYDDKFNIIDEENGIISDGIKNSYTDDVIDSVLIYKTDWDSKLVKIKAGFHKGELLALSIQRGEGLYDYMPFDNDSTINIYIKKYGEPEKIIDDYWKFLNKEYNDNNSVS